MAINIVRFTSNGRLALGRSPGQWRRAARWRLSDLTAALIERGEGDWRAAAGHSPSIGLEAIELLSPVTTPCRVFCQGANYRRRYHRIRPGPRRQGLQHVLHEVGCVDQPADRDRAWPPDHAKLLDYEIELALVFRRAIRSPVSARSSASKVLVRAGAHRFAATSPSASAVAPSLLRPCRRRRCLILLRAPHRAPLLRPRSGWRRASR